MNRSELEDFVIKHDARCPGFSKWTMDTEDATERVDFWLEQLADVSVDVATAASKAIALQKPRPYFSEHIAMIAAFAKKATVDDFVVKCSRCNGKGVASCKIHIPHFSGDENAWRAPGIYPCICPCSAGQRKKERQDRLIEAGDPVHLIPEKPNWVGGKTGRPAAEYVESGGMTEVELMARVDEMDEGVLQQAMARLALKPLRSVPKPEPEDWLPPAQQPIDFPEYDPDNPDEVPF